jgi:DNA-binding NarL/FixJ family response regulator
LSILTEKEVLTIIEKLKNGSRNIELANEFKVAHNTIDDIRCNRTWRYLERAPILGNGPIKKLTGDMIPIIRKMFSDGFQDGYIAKQFGVAPATINQIRNGNTWRNY